MQAETLSWLSCGTPNLSIGIVSFLTIAAVSCNHLTWNPSIIERTPLMPCRSEALKGTLAIEARRCSLTVVHWPEGAWHAHQ